jgi:outer membrane lipoprotein-sorting protein
MSSRLWPFLALAILLTGSPALAKVSLSSGKALPKSQWKGFLKKVDATEGQSKDMKALLELKLVNKQGKKRVRRAVMFQKGQFKRLIQFKFPATERGLSVLVRGRTIHLFLPQLQKIKRIAAHVKNQSFMGTDMTFDDMGTIQFRKKWKIKQARRLKKGYFLRLVPKKGGMYRDILVRNDYSIIQIRFYNSAGKEARRMVRRKFTKIKKYTIPLVLEMRDLKSGHRTIMTLRKVKLDTNISRRMFSKRYLKRELDEW